VIFGGGVVFLVFDVICGKGECVGGVYGVRCECVCGYVVCVCM
jgi:hypothetical protein